MQVHFVVSIRSSWFLVRSCARKNSVRSKVRRFKYPMREDHERLTCSRMETVNLCGESHLQKRPRGSRMPSIGNCTQKQGTRYLHPLCPGNSDRPNPQRIFLQSRCSRCLESPRKPWGIQPSKKNLLLERLSKSEIASNIQGSAFVPSGYALHT
jgi:hypothetical protein